MVAATPGTIGAKSCGSPIIALGVARIVDEVVLARYSERATTACEIKGFDASLSQLLKRASKLPAYPGWREKVFAQGDIENGINSEDKIFALADSQGMMVAFVGVRAGLQIAQFPDRLAYLLLQELVEKVRDTQSDEKLSEASAGKLTGPLKGIMKELAKEYSDPCKSDKVTEVHEKVDKVKDLMQDNVKKILDTHVSLETLHSKSQMMSASADNFLKQSTHVKRQAYFQNAKVKIIIATSICAVGLYFALPLFT